MRTLLLVSKVMCTEIVSKVLTTTIIRVKISVSNLTNVKINTKWGCWLWVFTDIAELVQSSRALKDR